MNSRMETSAKAATSPLTATAARVLQEDSEQGQVPSWSRAQDGRRLQSRTFNMLNDLMESGQDVSSMYTSPEVSPLANSVSDVTVQQGFFATQSHVVKAAVFDPLAKYRKRSIARSLSPTKEPSKNLSSESSSYVKASYVDTSPTFHARPVMVISTEEEDPGDYAPLTPPLSTGEGEQLSPLYAAADRSHAMLTTGPTALQMSKYQLEMALNQAIAAEPSTGLGSRLEELSIDTRTRAEPPQSTLDPVTSAHGQDANQLYGNIRSSEISGNNRPEESLPGAMAEDYNAGSNEVVLKLSSSPRPFKLDPQRFRRSSLDPHLLGPKRYESSPVAPSHVSDRASLPWKRDTTASEMPDHRHIQKPQKSVFDLEGPDLDSKSAPARRLEQESRLRAQYTPRRFSAAAATSARYEEPRQEEIQYRGYTNPDTQSKSFKKLQNILHQDEESDEDDALHARTKPPAQYNTPRSLYGTRGEADGAPSPNLNPSTLALIQEMDAEKKANKH